MNEQVEVSSVARDDSEFTGLERRSHQGAFKNVGLKTKSSLGLDCRNTGRLYTSRAAHGP